MGWGRVHRVATKGRGREQDTVDFKFFTSALPQALHACVTPKDYRTQPCYKTCNLAFLPKMAETARDFVLHYPTCLHGFHFTFQIQLVKLLAYRINNLYTLVRGYKRQGLFSNGPTVVKLPFSEIHTIFRKKLHAFYLADHPTSIFLAPENYVLMLF